nr:MAG TPA: hypothetical protein [Caudoviricetes sp.]
MNIIATNRSVLGRRIRLRGSLLLHNSKRIKRLDSHIQHSLGTNHNLIMALQVTPSLIRVTILDKLDREVTLEPPMNTRKITNNRLNTRVRRHLRGTRNSRRSTNIQATPIIQTCKPGGRIHRLAGKRRPLRIHLSRQGKRERRIQSNTVRNLQTSTSDKTDSFNQISRSAIGCINNMLRLIQRRLDSRSRLTRSRINTVEGNQIHGATNRGTQRRRNQILQNTQTVISISPHKLVRDTLLSHNLDRLRSKRRNINRRGRLNLALTNNLSARNTTKHGTLHRAKNSRLLRRKLRQNTRIDSTVTNRTNHRTRKLKLPCRKKIVSHHKSSPRIIYKSIHKRDTLTSFNIINGGTPRKTAHTRATTTMVDQTLQSLSRLHQCFTVATVQESDRITRKATLGSHITLHTLKNKPVDPVFEFLILAAKIINHRPRITIRGAKLLQLGEITFSTRLPLTGLSLPIRARRPRSLTLHGNITATNLTRSPLILHNINSDPILSGIHGTIVNILFFNFLIGHSLTYTPCGKQHNIVDPRAGDNPVHQ